jgi:hypothetical protein
LSVRDPLALSQHGAFVGKDAFGRHGHGEVNDDGDSSLHRGPLGEFGRNELTFHSLRGHHEDHAK